LARDVRILKFLSPRQFADFDHGSAVNPRLQQERNIGSASALNNSSHYT